ncbi:Uu.00g005360.m01.CDS01 [Anthostomella pinea]|uniref:Uu.00g005360.m01.CDS01 n=1 Tax=Anthostomella pinea TaxID=933095 RepID=A0AAI8YIS8_9PEZI|nr:Uu.00g005360.m01.CDS01 [Anthostomella pinea]
MSKPTKAELYLGRLEDARCEGNWDEVPELVRKVRKHTSDRECTFLTAAPFVRGSETDSFTIGLATTAETEFAIIKASQKQRPESKSATAVSPTDLDVAHLLPKLHDAFEGENAYDQDKFQAQVCAGWLHWTVGEYELAEARLPQNLENQLAQLEQSGDLSEWTRVCFLKAAYLKANCLSRSNKTVGALAVFESASVSLSHVWTGQQGRKQLQFWSELFLTEWCMLHAQALERGEKSLEDANSLSPFRSWAKYWEVSKAQGPPHLGGFGFRGAVPRRRVWNEYYAAISGILQQDLPYPTGNVSAVTNEASARNQLRMELKKVEAVYEGLLLSETSFPRAEEEREDVENFVSAVMSNWSILSGRDWHQNDLGPGGKEGLSRGVLDILYRAATKTFHSTAILRDLFTVHLSVAEFDLAFHALDSYMEIVKKGKARVDKTGHPEPSLDDDATVLETISQAITALCKYGFRDAAEKARDLGVELENMLQSLPTPLSNDTDGIPTLDEENGDGVILHPRIPARVYGLSWQAIGLSQAQWSRTTYDASERNEIQAKAIRSLRKSLSPENGNPTDVRTLFTLGLLLAEQRELNAAIDILKAALMSNKNSEVQVLGTGLYWRERSLIPLWHLLALLLSAEQDFVTAARACEGAFEQFEDPAVLFGAQNLEGTFRSEHLNEAEAQEGKSPADSLVDQMDDLEKEGIVEVKMTQLALLELLEGPEVAVNASHELLVLYMRLFGSMQPRAPVTAQKSALDVPKSSAGTFRTMRGSIFGHKSEKSSRFSRRGSVIGSEKPAPVSERSLTSQTAVSNSSTAPTIHVTKENGDTGDSRQSTRSASTRGRRSDSTRRGSLKKRDSSAQQQRRAVSSDGAPHETTVVDGEPFFTPMGDGSANERPDFFAWSSRNDISSQQSFSRGRGLLRFDSSVSSVMGSATGSDVPVLDSLSSPNPLPTIQFPEDQVKRQRHTILIKVWLMIASFYRRAKLYSDAKSAINEAKKLVDNLEIEIAKDSSGALTSRNPGWGGKKCVEELWGDVRTEMGVLAVAESTPYLARAYFEEALMHYPDHPSAIVGLSNILLDVNDEVLLPPPSIPSIQLPDGDPLVPECTSPTAKTYPDKPQRGGPTLPTSPLGLGGNGRDKSAAATRSRKLIPSHKPAGLPVTEELPAPHKAVSLPLVDRLAARDRAYGLLSGLTQLGTGWNFSDAWFALARAHEESGQPDKAKEALWRCVELEEAMGVRDWNSVGVNGYVL